MSRTPGSASEAYKQILKKIAAHGSEEIEWTNKEGRLIKSERLLIALEVIFEKGVKDKDLRALQYYMDRLLGRPKESLNLTHGTDLIGKLTDDQLTEKISAILEAARERGAGESD